MKKGFLILMALGLYVSSHAYANDDSYTNFYTKVQGGVNFLQTENHSGIKPCFNTGYSVSAAFGYQWCYGLHIEAEYAYRRNSMKRIHYFGQDFDIPGSFQSSSSMTNLLWDFSLWEWNLGCAQPFLGAGVGYDVQQFHASQNGFKTNQKKKGFAWQLMAGFNYPLFDQTDIALEYRFHQGPLHNYFSHVIGVSITYTFGCQCY